MKTRDLILLLLTIAIAFMAHKSAAENLIENGSFEVNNSFSGWGYTGGLRAFGNNPLGIQCADGDNAVGTSWQSTLYQNVPTVAGEEYRLSFYLACWGTDHVPATTVSLVVSTDAMILGTVSFDGTGKTAQNMGWREFEFVVTAIAATTRITFFNPSAPFSVGTPMIDDVSLVAIEPGSTFIPSAKVAAWGNSSSGQLLLPNKLNGIKQIAAGNSHSLALKSDGTVIGWGSHSSGTTNPPAGLSNVVAIAAGAQHSLALRADGTVRAWGSNGNGQTNVPTHLSGVVQISAGSRHCLALMANGTVMGWGGGPDGEGYVPFGLSNVKAVDAGVNSSLVLKRDGTVMAWGSSTNGNVPAGLANVVAIASGTYQNLALKADGTVVAWGIGYSGQTNPPPGLSNVIAVSVGANQSLALKADGTVAAWGSNLGATNIPPGLSNVTAIAAGGSHNLAIVSEGPPEIIVEPTDVSVPYQSNLVLTVTARGFEPLSYRWIFKNFSLADSTRVSGSQTASLTISNAQFSDAGSYRVIVTNALGSVQSTGAAVTVVSPPLFFQHPPNRTVNAGTNITLSAGAIGTPAISYQWLFEGEPIAGQTKTSLNLTNVQSSNAGNYSLFASNVYGVASSSNAVLSVTEIAPYIVTQPTNRSVILGGSATFSVGALGTMPFSYQWRREGNDVPGATNSTLNLSGVSFGDEGVYTVAISNSVGVTVSAKAFLAVSKIAIWGTQVPSALYNFPPGLSNVVALSAGDSHIVALKSDGTVKAWGSRRLRIRETFPISPIVVETDNPATNVPPNLDNVTSISAGAWHNLALKFDGTVVAWGDNSAGQTNVPSNLSNVVAIAVGGYNSLALLADDTIVAWGGVGRLLNSRALTNVPMGLSNLTAIAAGLSHGMVLGSNGRITSWGSSSNIPAGLSNVIAFAFGNGSPSTKIFGSPDDYLALRADGTVASWSDRYVTLPNGFSVVSALSNVVAIAGAPASIMALKSDGSVYVSKLTHQPPPGISNIIAIAAGGAPYGSFFTLSTSEFYVAAPGDGFPAFALHPASQTASKGGEIKLHARAAGVEPMHYQWQLNGANISGATNATFVLTNVQPKDLGDYRAMASNAIGIATSSAASVTIPTQPLPSALNAPSLSWATGGSTANAGWFSQLAETHDGEASAQSGRISHNEFSQLQTTVNGPGTISFWWKSSSEQGYDFLQFVIGETNAPLASLSGESSWRQRTFAIPAGPQILTWIYSKDATVSAGADAGWLDEIFFMPLATPTAQKFLGPQILADGSFMISVVPSDGQTVSPSDWEQLELQTTSNLVDWIPLTNSEPLLSLTNGGLLLRDVGGSNHPVRFYRVIRR